MVKFLIFGTGTISGIGKGNTLAAIGKTLAECENDFCKGICMNKKECVKNLNKGKLKIIPIKIDPYLNKTPSTINPVEHGEVFVTEDGTESDLDFGIYERNLNIHLSGSNNITGGKLYDLMRQKEHIWFGETITHSKMHFLIEKMIIEGVARTCIRNYPNYTYKNIEKIEDLDNDTIILIEVGGVISDPENVIFLDYLANLSERLQDGNHICKIINIDLVPIVNGELKTKLIQNSIKLFRSKGLTPNLSICRVPKKFHGENLKNIEISTQEGTFNDKISSEIEKVKEFLRFKGIKNPIISPDVINTYLLSYIFFEQDLNVNILKMIGLEEFLPQSNQFDQSQNGEKENLVKRIHNDEKRPCVAKSSFDPFPWAVQPTSHEVNIGIVMKYSKNLDSYRSVIDSLIVSGLMEGSKVNIVPIDAEAIESAVEKATSEMNDPDSRINTTSHFFKDIHGVIIPGGFGHRGTEGKIHSIEYCRVKNLPTLNICLGFQLAIIEFLRNKLSIDANSEEFVNSADESFSEEDILALQENSNSESSDSTPSSKYHKVIKIIEGTSRSDSALRLGTKLTIVEKDSNVFKMYNDLSRVRFSYKDLIETGSIQISKILGNVCICGLCSESIECKVSNTGVSNFCVDDVETAVQNVSADEIAIIEERHRHRYEVNPLYLPILQANSMKFVGKDLFNPHRFSIFENKSNDYFVGVQFHPEMTLSLENGHPLFRNLIKHASRLKQNQ